MPKILIVEDNDLVLDMMQEWLSRQKWEVVIATDGVQGVGLAKTELPHLILLDMSLPLKDGWTAAREIKAYPALAHTPILALTANAVSGDREKALDAGCDDYVTKPFNFAKLLEKIQTYLEWSTAQPAAK